MIESGLTQTPVTLLPTHDRFAARLDNACSIKLKELDMKPYSSALICRVVKKDCEHGRKPNGMHWQAKKQSSGPPYWMRPLQPNGPHSVGEERQKLKSEQGSECGGRMDHTQTMAKWEPQQCVNTELNEGLATVF
jgi:hypothetical protein